MQIDKCLVVSRHKLLRAEENDVETICKEWTQVPELPTDPKQLQANVQDYNAVIGTLPLALIDLLKKANKTVLTFEMTSVGTYKTEDEAKKLEEQYPDRIVILPPSKPGELYRVSRYDGISEIVKINIEKKPIIRHDPLSSYIAQSS